MVVGEEFHVLATLYSGKRGTGCLGTYRLTYTSENFCDPEGKARKMCDLKPHFPTFYYYCCAPL